MSGRSGNRFPYMLLYVLIVFLVSRALFPPPLVIAMERETNRSVIKIGVTVREFHIDIPELVIEARLSVCRSQDETRLSL